MKIQNIKDIKKLVRQKSRLMSENNDGRMYIEMISIFELNKILDNIKLSKDTNIEDMAFLIKIAEDGCDNEEIEDRFQELKDEVKEKIKCEDL